MKDINSEKAEPSCFFERVPSSGQLIMTKREEGRGGGERKKEVR